MSKPFQKFVEPATPRPYAKPEAAAAHLIAIAKELGADRDGRISVGKWNAAFIWRDKGSVAEYSAGRDHAIASGVLKMHECGGFIMWTAGVPPE